MYTKQTTTTGWSNTTVISDGFGGVYWNDGDSYTPTVAVDNSDKIHVVWADATVGPWGTDHEIMYASITMPTPVVGPTQGIPYGNFYLLFFLVGILGIIVYIKRKI